MELWPREEAIEEHLVRMLDAGDAVALRTRHRTWDAFLDETARAGAGVRPLGAIEARLALRAACAEAAQGTPFTRVAATRGFVDAAARFVAECERAGLTASEVVRAAAAVPGASGERLRLLADVFARVVRRTEHAGASPARRRAIAARVLRAARGRREAPIVIRPRLPWEPADVEIVLALARTGPVRLELPWAADQPAVYHGLEPVLSAIEAHPELAELELALLDPAEAAPGARAELLRALYAEGRVARPPLGEPPPVTVLAAANPAAEMRSIAAHVRRLVDGGCPPEAIAIASRDPGAIGRRLAEEMARVGLALLDRRGPPLAAAPPARLALALYGLPRRGFRREDVLAIVTSRYVAAGVADGGPYLPPHAIARRAREMGLLDLGPAGRERLARSSPEGARMAAHLGRLLEPISALPEEATIAAHAATLAAALERLGVPERARAFDPTLDEASPALAVRVERALARDQAAADAIEDLLGGLGEAAEAVGARGALGRDAFAALLADLMAETPLRAIGARGGAVRLVHLVDLASRSFEHVIVPGLLDGAAPARAADDGLWGEPERRALVRALGRRVLSLAPGDGADAHRTPFEELMLVLALAAARRSALVTYATCDGDRPTVRSPFVDEILRAAPWTPVVVQPPSPVPELADAAAPADLLARMALELYADPAGRLPRRATPVARPLALYEAVRRVMPERVRRVAALAAIERQRWRWFAGLGPAGPHAGHVGARTRVAALGAAPEAALGARQLDLFANCPFTVLAGKVLGVRPPEEMDAAPDPRDVGRLAHACLERFYRRRAEAGALPLGGGDDDRAAIEAACAEVFAEAEAAGEPGHPALWELARARVLDEARRWIEREARTGPPGGGVPARFEVAFGGRGAELPPLRLGDLWVSGRIDRIDLVGADGAIVIDYKSGRLDRERAKLRPDAAGRLALQLPIYAAAARQALGRRWADGAFVSLRDGAPTPLLGDALGGREALAALLDAELPARVGEMAERMRAGEFEVRPVDCRGCDYRTACRVVALAEEEP